PPASRASASSACRWTGATPAAAAPASASITVASWAPTSPSTIAAAIWRSCAWLASSARILPTSGFKASFAPARARLLLLGGGGLGGGRLVTGGRLPGGGL